MTSDVGDKVGVRFNATRKEGRKKSVGEPTGHLARGKGKWLAQQRL
jgi:hypothetical protein